MDDDNIEIKKIENKTIIIITIPRANRRNKPIYINNNPLTGTFIRFRDGDFHCEKSKIRTMMIESEDKKTRDSIVLEEFNINSINLETLNDYRAVFKSHKGDDHMWSKLSDEEFLCVINAMDRETKKLKLAGLLMFGNQRDIVEILPGYFLDYREVRGVNVNRWSHRITSGDGNWSGNLWDFFEKIVNRLTEDIETPFALNEKMMRIDNTEIHESVREALTNTLVHFQLDESGSVVVEKKERYFKFANPGSMRIPVEEALKGGQSDPRNPILHQMFSYLGYGERAGSGLSRINNAWKEKEWIMPKIEEQINPDRTTLILEMRSEQVNLSSNVEENSGLNSGLNSALGLRNKYPELPEIYIDLLELIVKDKYITQYDMAIKLNKTKNAVERNIKTLREKGILERIGSKKDGYWKIKRV